MKDPNRTSIENGIALSSFIILLFLWGMFSFHGYSSQQHRDLEIACEKAGYVLKDDNSKTK